MKNRTMNVQYSDGIPEVSCEQLQSALNSIGETVKLIDVRQESEFYGELGHIAGSKLITLGPEFLEFLKNADKDQEIVFICRSGARSGAATAESLIRGFNKTANLTGGMVQWNQLGFPVSKT